MNQCCFICNNRAGLSLRNATSLFGDHNTLTSGKKVSEVLSEIIAKPIQEDNVHTNILCKKCYKACNEYDSLQVRLKAIKNELVEQFKLTLPHHNLDYENYEKKIEKPPPLKPKVVGKKLVLPASKLQPVSPELLLKVGKLAGFSKPLPQLKTLTPSTLNLKVTVGSSVLTQTIKTTVSKQTDKQALDSNILTSLTNALKSDIEKMTSTQPSPSTQKSAMLNFNVNTLPKDFLSDKSGEEVKGDENNDDHPMEIDEDCLSMVPVTTSEGGNLVLQVEGLQSKSQNTPTVNEYLDVELPESLEVTDSEVNDAQKYILGKLRILNDSDTIVVDGENGSILQMMAGQKFIYEGGEISLVMPDDDAQNDGDGDQNDNGDGQDSNDESQIELQVSGDEETANAIIAAAQEQGGAFIKVESGEMFRVKSVSSTTTDVTDNDTADKHDGQPTVDVMQIVAQEGTLFKCLLCQKNEGSTPCLGDAESMMRHLKTIHDARIYICNFCGIFLRKRNDYTNHIAQHASGTKPGTDNKKAKLPHQCTECNKSFGSRALLAQHANLHTGARPYQCDICHKTFANKYTHQTHLKTHAIRPRPHKCNQCGKSFLTQQYLNQHEKTHSGIKDFVCTVCNKAFSTQHNLEVHGVVHSGNKPYACTVCGKAFARAAELRDHNRIHTGERPFCCDICGARFTQRSNLHSHRRATHLDDKRHHCNHCNKRFKRRRLLEYHIKASHTGERPLVCNVCHSSFVYPEHYKKHMRIHSGERPYVCEICGKSFNSRDNRNTHRFVHSAKKPYECVACGAGFMRKQQLYAHMNSSGHLAESIVVNQARVVKVNENGTSSQATTNGSESETKFDTIFEINELDSSIKSVVKTEALENNLETAKLFITEDKKIILQDKTTLDLIQDTDDPTLLTIHNIRDRTDGTILEAVDAEQLDENAEIVANDENGGMVRLIQIKLPDGNNGWVALNR